MAEESQGRPTLLVLASTYPRWPGDPEPGFVHELCKRLASRMHVVALVPDAPRAEPNGLLDGVEVVRYRYAPRRLQTLVNDGGITTNLRGAPWKWLLVPGFIIGQLLAARRILAARRVALVHAHWLLPQGVVAWVLRRRCGYVVTSHGADLFGFRGRLASALKRRVANDARAMTVVSTAMREEAKAIGLCPPELRVQPMGVDLLQRFTPDATERAPDRLLFVGRLVAKKGIRYLLDAMPAVLARHPSVRLDIAGFGPEEAALRSQCARLGIDAQVRFLGAVSQAELPALYRRATALVAPFVRVPGGDQEGLGLVLVEALGCGCPVVTTRVPPVRDVFGGSWPEFAADPGDAASLASAIDRLLCAPGVASAAVQAQAPVLRARFDWDAVARSHATLLLDAARVGHPVAGAPGDGAALK